MKQLTKTKKNPPSRSLISVNPISTFTRPLIIQSHRSLGPFLNRFMINRLNALFKNNGRVTEFVKEERRRRGLDETNTTIESMVYGTKENNTTLLLEIKKNGERFIHLTIHLSPEKLGITNKSTGIVHIVKNIYREHIGKKKEYLTKSMYAVYQPHGKPHSLQFRIKERYTTPELVPKTNKCDHTMKQKRDMSTTVTNKCEDNVKQETNVPTITNRYDDEVKQEMDVLTTVLNKLFDENDREHYVGDYDAIHFGPEYAQKDIHVEPNTNNILRNINTHSNAITRKNKGVYFKNNTNRKGGKRTKRNTRRTRRSSEQST